MNMKDLLVTSLALVITVGGVYWLSDSRVGAQDFTPLSNTVALSTLGEKIKVANFTGNIKEVNTGCVADGECYIVVGGKHVTVLMGRNQEIVGSIMGVDSIGDLESHVGKDMEVYAQDTGDGTYTLYGSSGFYAMLK